MQMSIVIPALNEGVNLKRLLPRLHHVVSTLSSQGHEIIVVDGGSTDDTVAVVQEAGARVVTQEEPGYGGALKAGFAAAQGEYILTLDADLSHDPDFVEGMWRARQDAEVIVASRYVSGGSARMPFFRKVLSLILNRFFTKGLSLPLHDISSGFRLYRASAVKEMGLESSDFDVLEEILIRCYARGWRIKEIPFQYLPRQEGDSHIDLLRFGFAYLRTFRRMWELRNSILCADYDDRAFDSRIPPQRYWQRRRHHIVTKFASGAGSGSCLDVGCGSSRILASLDRVVGVDVLVRKLRWARKYGKPLVNASAFDLPFRDASFDCVICSEVIEHIPAGQKPFLEMKRVLKDGGILILGTPDYGRLSWRIIEGMYHHLIPGGYADEHITQYTREDLARGMQELGFVLFDVEYVLGSEMIMLLRKAEAP
jgi:glycosyltransferase involved in cell wall biosynthesis